MFGVEAELSATNAKGTAPCLLVLSCKTEQNWMATAAGRLGLADGRILYYVKGGAAWSHNTYSANLNLLLGLNTEVSDTRWGWLVGAGIEHAFAGTGLSTKTRVRLHRLRLEKLQRAARDHPADQRRDEHLARTSTS